MSLDLIKTSEESLYDLARQQREKIAQTNRAPRLSREQEQFLCEIIWQGTEAEEELREIEIQESLKKVRDSVKNEIGMAGILPYQESQKTKLRDKIEKASLAKEVFIMANQGLINMSITGFCISPDQQEDFRQCMIEIILTSLNRREKGFNPERASFSKFFKYLKLDAFNAFKKSNSLLGLPSHYNRKNIAIHKGERDLRASLNSDPSLAEIAEYLGTTAIQLQQIKRAGDNREYLWIDEDSEGREILLRDDEAPIEDLINNIEISRRIKDSLIKLPARAEAIIRMRYGLDPYKKDYTLKEIGDVFGLTKERVRQILEESLPLLKAYINI